MEKLTSFSKRSKNTINELRQDEIRNKIITELWEHLSTCDCSNNNNLEKALREWVANYSNNNKL